MINGILVGARARMTVGILFDTSDNEPRFRVSVNDAATETLKEASIEVAEAAELLLWLQQALQNPRAL